MFSLYIFSYLDIYIDMYIVSCPDSPNGACWAAGRHRNRLYMPVFARTVWSLCRA